MMFTVSKNNHVFSNASRNSQHGASGKVAWIKEFREQTGLGLMESKHVADFIADFDTKYVTIDTNQHQHLEFLANNNRIKYGYCDIIKVVDNFKATDSELDQILNKIGAKIQKPTSAREILKKTAIKLIRENHIKEASGVLDILRT